MDQSPANANQSPRKRAGNFKWVFIGCGGLLVVVAVLAAIGMYMASRAINVDPPKVEADAQAILPFDMPAGFKGSFSMSIGVHMAILTAVDEEGADKASIVLAALPGSADTEEGRPQLREMMKRQGHYNLEVSGPRPAETFKVRGAETLAQVSTLSGKDGAAKSLQYTLTVNNPSGGLVSLTLFGQENFITHDWVQGFLGACRE